MAYETKPTEADINRAKYYEVVVSIKEYSPLDVNLPTRTVLELRVADKSLLMAQSIARQHLDTFGEGVQRGNDG